MGIVLFFSIFAVYFGKGVVGLLADRVEEGLQILALVTLVILLGSDKRRRFVHMSGFDLLLPQ